MADAARFRTFACRDPPPVRQRRGLRHRKATASPERCQRRRRPRHRKSTDNAENEETVKVRSFTIERDAPVVRSRSPAPEGTMSPSSAILVTHDDLNGTLPSGIDAPRTVFILERALGGTHGVSWVDATGEGTLSKTASETRWTPNGLAGLAPGWYRVRGFVFDRAGNSSPLEPATGWEFQVSPV